MKTAVLIMSGGQGRRFGNAQGKQLFEYNGQPIMFYTIEKFKGLVDKIIVLIDPLFKKELELQLLKHKIKVDGVVEGGTERYDSVKNGLEFIRQDKEIEYVLIHDGARPNISKELIIRSLEAVKKYSAVIPVVPVKDTIKEIAENIVKKTIPRKNLVQVQTPQCFKKEIIIKAYQQVDPKECTDDAMVLEKAGQTIFTIPGEEKNIKITTQEDLKYLKLS